MGAQRIYALIGNPVAHSLSPSIMQRAFQQGGCDAVYLALPVPARDLRAAVDGLSLIGAGGANVTYPYKEAVIEHVGALSDDAAAVGAVNTLVWDDAGARGHNTDATGAATALERLGRVRLAGARAFIYGAGGSARAAALGLLQRGASLVTLGLRSHDRRAAAVARLRGAVGDRLIDTVGLGPDEYDARRDALVSADVVINATPVGMVSLAAPGASLIEDASWIRAHQCYFDFVYHPRRTAFIETAQGRGARVVDGLAMLVAQAAESFRLWTGEHFDIADMTAALNSTEPGADQA